MCGIVSLLSRKGPVTQRQLKSGADALAHRGPDGEGFWVSPDSTAGLAHRRLSIIDLSTGEQPLFSTDGKKVAIVNGELYDHRRIRRELEARGCKFKTRSDSEILLHLYDLYGTDCLRHMRGEFAFVLWDEEKRRLFAARDRFGIKPLCYAENAHGLFVASEAKALFAMGVPAAWDDYAFYHSASLQYTPQDRTLFKGVFQLKPGHAMVATVAGTRIFKYWDLDYPAAESAAGSDEDAIARFGELFGEAVRLRLEADVPVCFHLSGGLDSSAVLGVAAEITGKPVNAFTVTFDHGVYDEFKIAEETAKRCGAVFHPVRVTQEDIVRDMSDAVWHGEGLAINGHITAKHLLNKAIRNAGFKVALTGEGADEVLAGYPHLRQDLFNMSPQKGAAMTDALYAANAVSAGVQLASGDTLPVAAVRGRLGYMPAFLEAKASLGHRMHGVLSSGFKAQFRGRDCYAEFIDETPVAEQLSGRHPVNQSSWLWTKTALANYILRTLGDGMEMSCSIEGRLPFLDHRLFEYARSLPMRLKINGTVEKYILREAMRKRLTPTVYKRQKHPFMAPPVARFSDMKLMDYVRDSIGSKSFGSVPFYDGAKAKALIDGMAAMNDAEKTAAEPVLMMMLTSHIIHERFRL